MEELELKHITPYLPYGLEFKSSNKIYKLEGVTVGMNTVVDWDSNNHFINNIKPILRPLSSMTKKEAYDLLCLIIGIEDIGFKQSDLDYISLNYEYSILEIKGGFPFNYFVSGIKYTINISNDGIACFDTESNGAYIPHSAYDYLLSKHFDIFGLIDEGFAVNKDKL